MKTWNTLSINRFNYSFFIMKNNYLEINIGSCIKTLGDRKLAEDNEHNTSLLYLRNNNCY